MESGKTEESAERRPFRGAMEAAVVGSAAALFIGGSAFKAVRQPYPYFDDVDYLALGNLIQETGGALHLWSDLIAGRFTESNRHPLYLDALALFARPEFGYHRDARVLAVALGALALIACWWTARRYFGREAAALVAVMLAGSGALIWTASRECADTLLVLFWALSIGGILDGARNGGVDDGPNRKAWLLAGVWGGLAYLSKGPGIFLPICLALALLRHNGLRALRDMRVWLFAGAFAVVSFPLWWRNLKVFGSPTYNSNENFVWIDRLSDFAEVFAPYADSRMTQGAQEYIAQVTPGALGWRFGMGLLETIFHFGDSMALVAPGPGTVLHVVWVIVGIIAGGVALFCLWWREEGFARSFLIVHAAWWLAFLWFFNANGGASRYFLPLVTTTLVPVLAARLVAGLPPNAGLLRGRWVRALLGAVLFAVASTLVLDRSPTRAPAGFVEVQEWLVRRLGDGEVYAIDARTHLQPRWLAPRARQLIVSASWKNKPVPADEMLRYFCEQKVHYVVLDAGSETNAVEVGDARARYFFYDQLLLEPDGSLPLQGFPGGLRAVYAGAEAPRRWMVLETACAGQLR